MAIGSVYELVDYKQETIKLAKKYGGGGGSSDLEPRVQELELEVGQLTASVLTITGDIETLDEEKTDLTVVGNAYNPNQTAPYNVGDLVVYNGKLYKCKSRVPQTAGTFDPLMWDRIADYDTTQTYNTYDFVEYDSKCWRCDEDSVTGEWDSTKWTDVTINYEAYNEASTSYYPSGTSGVSYETHFYRTNATYENTGSVGEFNSAKWDETKIANNMAITTHQYVKGYDGTGSTTSQASVSLADTAGKIVALNVAVKNRDGEFIKCPIPIEQYKNIKGMSTISAHTTLVVPHNTGVDLIDATIANMQAGGYYLYITINKVIEIGLVQGDVTITTNTTGIANLNLEVTATTVESDLIK